MTERAPTGDLILAWTPTRDTIDAATFDSGMVGPYRLGAPVRETRLGYAVMAIRDDQEAIVELELCESLVGGALAGLDGDLLADVAAAFGLEHPALISVLGGGMENGAPYIVRPHILGRTVSELFVRASSLAQEVAVATLYFAADALAYLADSGPQPGSVCLGGFDGRDVVLGFDGQVRLTGLGTKLARSGEPRDAMNADFASLLAFAGNLDEASGLQLRSLVGAASSCAEAAMLIRRAHRDDCAKSASNVAKLLRTHFADAIQLERAFFGMASIH